MADTLKVIGGPKDGEYLTVRRGQHYVRTIAMDPLPRCWWDTADLNETVSFHEVTYGRSEIRGSNKVFTVFTPTDWDGDRLIEELIKRA